MCCAIWRWRFWGCSVANGKRRANGEKVLEERLAEQQQLTSSLNVDRLNQITDLQDEVYVMKKKAVHDRYMLAIVAILGLLTAVSR